MQKLLIFVWYICGALLTASVFGALHDQISYTVSQEYYTKFKFIQFGLLDTNISERLRAAIVGILASWWMGIPLGILTGLAGFMHSTPALMKRSLIWSLLFIMCFTLTVALLGLAYGLIQTAQFDITTYLGWYIPKNLTHPRNFLCAGYMHNAAYIGGMLSIPAAWIFHLVLRKRELIG